MINIQRTFLFSRYRNICVQVMTQIECNKCVVALCMQGTCRACWLAISIFALWSPCAPTNILCKYSPLLSLEYFYVSHCCTHFQDEYFSSCAIDVEFAVGRVVRVDALTSQEVYDVLLPVFIAIGCRHLHTEIFIILQILY